MGTGSRAWRSARAAEGTGFENRRIRKDTGGSNPSSSDVNPSLQAFVHRLIDYAGLFPPARLPMAQAVGVCSAFRHGPQAALLGRFICPATRLTELEEEAQERLQDSQGPWRITALAQGGPDRPSFLAALQEDLVAVRSFPKSPALACRVEVCELRVPESADPAELIHAAAEVLARAGLRPFFEIPWAAGQGFLVAALNAIQQTAPRFRADGGAPGAKIRTGGVSADGVPSCRQVAGFIAACRQRGIPLKATAGLHQALRHFDESLGAEVHGFLNVFTAAVAAQVAEVEEDELTAILACQSADEFRFQDQALVWRDLHLETRQIEQARSKFAVSYGSCSLDEPVEDLRRLGLLAR